MGSLTTLSGTLPGCKLGDLPEGQPVLALRDVHLGFFGVKALQGVSLEVARDELFAIIGPNGAGKSLSLIHI